VILSSIFSNDTGRPSISFTHAGAKRGNSTSAPLSCGVANLCSVIALGLSGAAWGQSQLPPLQPPPPPTPVFAEAGPWNFTGVLNVDAFDSAGGGLKTGPAVLIKGALSASYDGSKQGHDGLTGLVSMQYVNGTRFSRNFVGDAQGLDNIEASGAVRLYEAWIAHDYADSHLGWKVGLVDLNTDFDTQETAALFLNSSDGVGPEFSHSGRNGPSIFPTTALAVTSYLRPKQGWTLRAGLFDGTAGSPEYPGRFAIRISGEDGLLAIGQVERRYSDNTRIEVGVWRYTASFEALHQLDAQGQAVRLQRSHGGYALIEGPLLKSKDSDEKGLNGWLRVGLSDPTVNKISGYIGAGVVYTGLLARRPTDQVGLAINHAIVDQQNLSVIVAAERQAETAIELTYRYNANDWLVVQPDAQLIIRPSGDRTIPTALVVGVRFNITLTRALATKIKSK